MPRAALRGCHLRAPERPEQAAIGSVPLSDSSKVGWERRVVRVPGDLARAEICVDVRYADVTRLAQGKGLPNI